MRSNPAETSSARCSNNTAVNPSTAEINKCKENIEQLHQEMMGTAVKQIDRLVIEQEDNRGIEDKTQRAFDSSILIRWREAK